MNKRRKQGLVLLALSVPMMWWGFNQFIYGSGHSTLEAIAVSLSCTGGLTFFFGGLYLLFTKGRGEGLLASKTVGISPIPKDLQRDMVIQGSLARAWKAHKEPINKKPKVNEMTKAKDTVANTIKEIRELEESLVQSEEIIKKETLNAKTTTEKIAVLKHNLAKEKTVKELLAMLQEIKDK